MEVPPSGVGTYPAGCALGLEREARGLRAAGVSSRRKRRVESVLCVCEGRRYAGLFLLSCRVSDAGRNE